MTGARHRARAIALQALYEIDTVGHEVESTLAHCLEEDTSAEITSFVRQLVAVVLQHRQEIDSTIQRFAPAYPVEQLSAIDRNTLRLAIAEMTYGDGVPVKVAINEAVELAKDFGSEASSRFVNGVLGAIVTAGAPRQSHSRDHVIVDTQKERR